MSQKERTIYLTAFPLVTILLCALAYWTGWKKGNQARIAETTPAPREVVIPKEHETAENLTFFKDLRERDEPALNPSPAKPKTVAENGTKKSPAPPPIEEPEQTRSGFVVQVSAFKDVGKAHELIDDLKNRGYPAFSLPGAAEGTGWHRVYVGPYADKSKAEASFESLKNDGYGAGFVTRLEKR